MPLRAERALREVLRGYPIITGRLKKDADGHAFVDCNDAGIDWQVREAVQAKLRINVKKTLNKYGYPPDQQAIATQLVLEQAKAYGDEWSKKESYRAGGGASLLD